MTEEEKRLLESKETFYPKAVIGNKKYILVYKPESKLPNTGLENNKIATLVGLLGLAGVILIVRKNKKKVFVTVLAITTLGTSIASSDYANALQLELKAKLVETFKATVGDKLPTPKERIGNLIFDSYIE